MSCVSRTGAALVCLAVISGCGESGDNTANRPAAPASVSIPGSAVMIAETRTIHPSFRLPGLVESLQSAKVRPEVAAAVVTNHFQAGDMVKKGQILVELDDEKFVAALAAAKAQLESAKANVSQAEANWTRAEDLMPKGYISAQDYDMTKAAVETARAGVSQAEANLKTAELKLQRTRIAAPFSGRISKPGHAIGDQVGPLAPVPLFELAQLDPIYVSSGVEVGVYNKFTMLRKQLEGEGKEIPELEVTLELVGAGEYPHRGTFQAWDHTESSTRGMITGRAEFSNPDGILLPGLNVTLSGRAIRSVMRIFIPQKAVMQDQQGHFVHVIADDGTVQRKAIVVGIRDGADWAVIEGLQDGDTVIIEGTQKFAPGMRVTLGVAGQS